MATGQYLGELAVALAEKGHEITVVTGRRAYDDPEKVFPARENWRGVRIFRASSTRFGKQAKWRRAADFASFVFSCCARLIFLPRQDTVVALTTPPLISFIGAWRAKLWRARFCYWVMDLNPDEAVAAGWLRADSFAGRMLERMSRFSFRRADKIIALDRFMRDRIVAKGIALDKIVVIPPWSLDSNVRFDADGREQFRRTHDLQNKFVVMYSGNHSPVHPLDTLRQAAERLKDDQAFVFCFIGGGSEFKRVQHWATEGKRANVLCLSYQPLNQLSASLSAADAHVVAMGNEFVSLIHPCKIYDILAQRHDIKVNRPTTDTALYLPYRFSRICGYGFLCQFCVFCRVLPPLCVVSPKFIIERAQRTHAPKFGKYVQSRILTFCRFGILLFQVVSILFI